jgi:hypothetical protein
MLAMAAQARKLGHQADVFVYEQIDQAKAKCLLMLRGGFKIVVVGYSLGAGTATLLGWYVPLDLLIALDPSVWGYNYFINKKFVKRSVLWHGTNPLEPLGHAGTNLGFDVIHDTLDPHLFIDLDPAIQADVFAEIKTIA